MKKLVRAAIAAHMLIATGAAELSAADIPAVSETYTVTSWGYKNGLPSGGVHGLAQDADGYLWLGTNSGLLRFDGVSFASWESLGREPLPRRPIHQVLYAREGSLWIGFGGTGGIVRINDGRISSFGEAEGLRSGAVTALVEAADGTIWAANVQGLFRLIGEHWAQVGAEDGLPRGAVFSARTDHLGRLLLGTADEVLKRSESNGRFEHLVYADDRVMGLAESASGSLFITDPIAGMRRIEPESRSSNQPIRGRGYVLLRDRHGVLWVGTMGQGLWRLAPGEADDSTARSAGQGAVAELLGDWVLGLLEDRDDNIWVGTYEGLNRLSRSTMVPVPSARTASAIDLTPDGSVWVGTADSLLRFVRDGDRWRDVQRIHVPGLRALHVTRQGTVWVATSRDLFYLSQGRLIGVLPPRRDGVLSQITSIASDSKGGMWLYIRGQGPFRWFEGRLDALPWAPDFEAAPPVSAYTDRQGRVWFTSGRGAVRVIEPTATQPRSYDARDGLDDFDYGPLYEDSRGNIWLGGRGALSRFQEGRIQTVNTSNGFPVEIIRSIIEDDRGYLWIGTGSGIVRIDPAEFDRVLADPGSQIRFSLFDISDGVYGLPVFHGSRNAIRTGDGRLWFVTARGLTIVDPNTMRPSPPPPKVGIEAVVADGRRLIQTPPIRLPSRTDTLELKYSALDLSSPQKIRFRYRLDGFDKGWVDGDANHFARYTSLPPGDYRFRVTANTGEGTGPASEAMLSLSVPPVFYRTKLFYLVSTLTVALIIWTLWRLRLWQIHQTYSKILGERARLGRAIHDTLLQSLLAVAWQCDVMAHDLETAAPTTSAQFTRLRDLVEGYIREARHSIWDLRSPSLDRRDLTAALEDAGQHAVNGSGVEFDFTVHGTPHRYPDTLEEQLLRIGQEAVFNAVRHAAPSLVRVELDYTPQSIRLSVSDDGHGFDPALAQRSFNGHYGLSCMIERAQNLGGRLTIESAAQHGTTIEAIIPTDRSQAQRTAAGGGR